MVQIPAEIADLIAKFEQNNEAYRGPSYNEAQVRLGVGSGVRLLKY